MKPRPDRAAYALFAPVIRSAESVPANIAEGYGRYSDAAFRNHLPLARGSLFETESWLDLLRRKGHLDAETARALLWQCAGVSKLLTAAMKPLFSRPKPSANEERARHEI
jgi:four helix bundle protein